MTRCIIRCVPERMQYVDVMLKDIPHAELCHDEQRNGMHTFLKAMQQAKFDPCLHMEDDLELTSDFVAKVEKEVLLHPNNIINFFSCDYRDAKNGSHFRPGFISTVCFYLPKNYSYFLWQYHARWKPDHCGPLAFDNMVGDFLKSRNEKGYTVIPSLVQHLPLDSMMGHSKTKDMQSPTFIK